MTQVGWTLDELVAQVAAVLGNEPSGPASRRVRQVPDRRLVRWYTTIGLLDRPLLRGRTGWYGRRHLLQLVAVKRLQAVGRSLDQIQAELAGATDEELEAVAAIPADRLAGAPRPAAPSPRSGFWKAPPALPADQDPASSGAATRGVGSAATGTAPADRPDGASADGAVATSARLRAVATADTSTSGFGSAGARGGADGVEPGNRPHGAGLRYAVELADGVTLLLDVPSGTVPDPGELSAVREAARPLIHHLARRGLTRAVPEGDQS